VTCVYAGPSCFELTFCTSLAGCGIIHSYSMSRHTIPVRVEERTANISFHMTVNTECDIQVSGCAYAYNGA